MNPRYGENNLAFTVASFSGDDEDDKEDVTRKVTSAVEKVTSDYHSGSSSDEESNREARATPPFPQFQPRYQVLQSGPSPLQRRLKPRFHNQEKLRRI